MLLISTSSSWCNRTFSFNSWLFSKTSLFDFWTASQRPSALSSDMRHIAQAALSEKSDLVSSHLIRWTSTSATDDWSLHFSPLGDRHTHNETTSSAFSPLGDRHYVLQSRQITHYTQCLLDMIAIDRQHIVRRFCGLSVHIRLGHPKTDFPNVNTPW